MLTSIFYSIKNAVAEEGCKRYNLTNPIAGKDSLDLRAADQLIKGNSYIKGLRMATEEQNVQTGGLCHPAYDDAANTGRLLVKMLADHWTLCIILIRRQGIAREPSARS